MKLHLPKLLLTAVLVAVAAVGSNASALTVEREIVSYSSFSTAEGASITLPEGWTYDATTGTLTGLDYSAISFKLDTSALTSDNASTPVIYVTSTDKGSNVASWGFITDASGSNLTGYWNNYENSNGAYGSNSIGNGTLVAGKDESNKVILTASITSAGTYMTSDTGKSLYEYPELKASTGTVSSATINTSLVTDILYNVTYADTVTVSSTDGTWTREYAATATATNSFPTSKVDATIINGSTLQISGNNDTSSYNNPASELAANGGDIIVGNKGQLFLQTWQANSIRNGLDIDLSDADIFIGAGSDTYGALRLAAWSGNIVLGDITLIEDSAIWKETAANGNTVSFNGTVSGDYTLTVKQLDATSFNGAVDLSGLKTTGATTASFGSEAVATIDALTTQAATSLTAEDGASVTFVNVTLENNSRLTVTGDMEVTEQILSNSTGAGLTVNAESTLTAKKVKNSWGIDMQVDGLLEIGEGGLQMTSGHADTVKGSGIISTSVLGVGNTGTYTFEGGIRLEIGAGGIRQTTENFYANETTILKDVTIAATESWTNDVTKDLKLASESGTTFEIADTKTVAISGTLSDYSVTSADEDTATVYKGKLVKDGEGTLTLKGSNTYTGGTEVKAGKLVAATGAALGKAGTTTISGGSLEIQAAKATITKSAANTNAAITYISGAEGSTDDVYSIDNSGYQVENAKVELVADNATTISNRLIGVELVNNGTGAITAGNGYNDFTSINAASGDITLKGLAAEAGTGNVDTVDNLSIGENRTLSVYSNWTGTLTEATVKVTGSANFASGAIMNGNLVLGNGATVTMADALTMGSTLTLGTGMELDGALLTSVTGLTEGNTVDLFTGVDGLTLGSTSYDADTSLELGTETLSSYFGNVTNPDIYLGYNADTNVVYAGVMQTPVTPAVPEPTTATLSLLALAGLAARRRRK